MTIEDLWLTGDEKQRHLAYLAGRIEAGQVDEEIIPLLDIVNGYPDMVTVQSCSGHRGTVEGEGRRNVSDGHIWVRTTERVSQALCQHAPGLALEEKIYQVSLTWGHSNTYQQQEQPQWEVDFAGLNESPAALSASIIVIGHWLSWSIEVNWKPLHSAEPAADA